MAEGGRLPRVALAAGATLLAAAAGAVAVEAYARSEHLDLRRAKAIAVDQRAVASSEFRPAPADWGVPYLPRSFSLDETGFETAWGRCDWQSSLPTILVLGDSTTRQGSGRRASSDLREEASQTWAGRLRQALDGRYQVCVLAEDGYHPVHYEALARKVAEHTSIAHIVVLLCSNDIATLHPLVALPAEREGWLNLYELPEVAPVWPPLWNPWLHENSEAFRFFSWQMAERTGNRFDMPIDVPQVPWKPALDALAGLAPTTVFYLEELQDPGSGHLGDDRPEQALAEQGVAHTTIGFEPPWERWRRARTDVVHMSDLAHEQAFSRMLPVIEADLAR